jgi:nucleoside-diphosphate kinase
VWQLHTALNCAALFCANVPHITQMVDIKNRRHFLKKVRPPVDVRPELLFVGSTVTVYSRQLKIIDYGDEYTRSRLEAQSERCGSVVGNGSMPDVALIDTQRHGGTQSPAFLCRTLAMVKPDAFKNLGKIIHAIYQSGFFVK